MTERGDGDTFGSVLGESIERVEAHVVENGYRGYDPYDALTSRLFRATPLRASRAARLAFQQALKRLPFNLRPVLGIRKGYNPVTVAFALEAAAYLAHADRERSHVYRSRALELVADLERLRSHGSGACWGYDFDWESRYGGFVPAGAPTIVATGLVANALFVAHRTLDIQDAGELCVSAAQFALEDLPRHQGSDGTFCWGYYPGDRQRVLNATMKGARLCAQAYAITGDKSVLAPASATAAYVAAHQRRNGSWPYAVGDPRTFVDNFHTAYVLDAFHEYERHTQDDRFRGVTDAGWLFYRRTFFVEDQIPRYYATRLHPIDATSCAQSLLTLCRFGDVETARRVAAWTIENMQYADGHFAYQQRRWLRVGIPYTRWASAYMYLGLARLALALPPGASERQRLPEKS
jgi:hypothetical protein